MQTLKDSELRYRRLFEAAQDGILILDARTGMIEDVNPYLIKMLGFSHAELIKKKIWDVRAFKDIEASKDAFEALQKDEYIRYEDLPLKTKDGRLIQVEFVSNVYLVGGEKVIQCNIRDITEHRRVIVALQENEKKYHDLINQSPDGYFIIELSGKILTVNKVMCKELEISEEEFLSMSIWEIIPEQYLDQYRERLTKILKGESWKEAAEYEVRGKDGKIHYVEVLSAPRYSGKDIIGFQGIARDITARMRAEDELTIANKELAFQNEEKGKRAAELIIANKELAFQNEEKEKRAAELTIANKELAFQNEEKEKRATELITANKELAFQNEEKEKRAAELSTIVENLKRNEDLLRETGILAKVGGAEIHLSDMTLNWTEEVFRIHELEPGRMPSVEEGIDYYAPEARPIIREAVNNAIATGEGWSLELPFITAKGKHLWIRSIGKPEMKDGKTSRILGVFQDITERKQAEEALRLSEEKYRTLVDEVNDGFYVSDGEGVFTFANPALARMYGVETPQALVGRKLSDFLAPEMPAALGEAYGSAMQTGRAPKVIKGQIIRPDGTRTFIEVKPTMIVKGDQIVGTRGVVRDITERKEADERIRRQLEHLNALSAIDRVIAANFDLSLSLTEILSHVTMELGIDAADILILNSYSQMLEYGAERGFRTQAARKAQVRLGEGYAGRAALERQLVQIQNLGDEPGDSSLITGLTGEGFACYYGVPLITKGQVKGVLEIFHRTALEPDPEWFDFLNALAGQTAIAIENATLFESLQRSNLELTLAYDATIEGWSRALDLRDKETEGHTQRVTEMTMKLARDFGLSEAELVQVRWGALLHDIGKMGVPDGILLKPSPLTDEEWVAMKKHPTFAYEMLAPIRYLRQALDIPGCHHEKWDGSGYPHGLKGAQIPLAARIFAVVDVWDALSSDRPYRAAWTKEKVREHIQKSSGTHFDPQVVEVFMRMPN